MASPDIDLDEERELDRDFPNRMARSAFEASLPRAAYVDEAFLELERERLWWAEWVAVGREEQLAGRRRLPARPTSRASGSSSCATRRAGCSPLRPVPPPRVPADDRRPAHRPRDRRRARPVGHVQGRSSAAPYHSWCYELDGAVRNAPFLGEADHFEPADFGLHPVDLDTWGGWIFVNLDAERVAAGHTLAGAAGRDPGAHRPLPAGRPPDGAPDRLRRAGQLEGHRRELQRVLPLLGRPPRAVPDRARVQGEGRREPRLGRGRARRPRARSRSR